MSRDPNPRTVLITGASSGIGAALAVELARRGHRLALVARRVEKLEGLADRLRATGIEVLVVPSDLADPEAPAAIVAMVVEHFGGLDVLVNNAGFGLPLYYSEESSELIRRQIAVNLTAPILVTRHALPCLLEARGVVINVGSAITAFPNPVFGVYGTTKAGLAFWNDALRRELRHRGLRVCLVEPGPVETGFFEAVHDLADGQRPLGTDPAPDGLYNPVRDRPPRCLGTTAEVAAQRIARLMDHPRRRLSFPRRTVWPWRALGGLFRLAPWLGDLGMSLSIRRIERERQRAREDAGPGRSRFSTEQAEPSRDAN